MKNIKYILLAAVTFMIDMGIKNHVEKWVCLDEPEKREGKFIIGGKHHNRGLSFNIADAHQAKIAKLSLFTGALLTIQYIYVLIKENNPLMKTGLSLQIGGAYSNTYDRVKRKYVVDYFSFNVKGKLGKMVFNLGDIALLKGTVLVLVSSLIKSKKGNKK
ncbi:MAG: signal peptidase II [Lachnospiraceae bacterium]|nr:signal peptidase II [Lachnospiraceae bacterium]